MTEDLKDLLAERPVNPDAGDAEARDVSVAQQAPPSPTVLDLDHFNRRLGKRLADEWDEQGVIKWPAFERSDEQTNIVADARAALFEPLPKLAENPIDKARAAWMRQLMETPEYKSLHAQTCLDNDVASIASKPICDQWLEYVQECGEDQPGDGDGEPGDEPGDGESIDNTLKRIRSTAEALKQAKGDVDAAHDLSAGLGMGTPGSPLDRAALAKYFKRVQESNRLRDILMMAGRMRKLCRSLQKQKTNAIRGELTGIEMSGDIGRLVPMEMLQVAGAVPELETLALYRLSQRRSLSYKHKKNEPKKSGPIVICVDESGSMAGDKIVAAKGLAMAMAWLAQHQQRWFALVGFSGGTEGTRIACPPGHKQQEQLIEWLLHFYGQGTTLDVPLAEVPNVYWPEFLAQGMPRGKTDVVIITDAQVDCPDEVRDAYKAWAKAEEVKTYSIIIGDEPGDLARVSDRCWRVDDIDLESDAVEGVLSI